jgi:predicted dehydrogenase
VAANSLSIGVIGVGRLGSHHARIFNAMQGCQLAGVYDIVPDRNNETAAMYNLPPCQSAAELIERADAISICTPTESHFAIARDAIEQGRHVFIEKPVCAIEEDAITLTEMAQDAKVIGAVGLIERFNPAVVSARERIAKPKFIEAHRLNQFSPRGLTTDVVLELMIHDIDLTRYLVGDDPIEIRAAGVPVLSQTDDIANCRLAFPDGCVANLTASRISANPMRKIRFFSQDNYTSLDLASKSVESYRLFAADAAPNSAEYFTVAESQGRRIARWSAPIPEYDALEAELADFRDAVLERRAPRVDLTEGTKSLAVALAVARACRDQTKITDAPPVILADSRS